MIFETGLFSIFIQMVVNVIEGWGLSMRVKPEDEIFRDLLKVEFAVEVIELVFYIILIIFFRELTGVITPFRYLDWGFTTPLLLVSLMAYMRGSGSGSESGAGRLIDFVQNNVGSIVLVWTLNFAMLLTGLIGELGLLSATVTTAVGFVPFAGFFGYIYENFVPTVAEDTDYKRSLFFWFVGFWALYGLFALLNYTAKNVSYNILDLFAKNFFGVFLSLVIWQRSIGSFIQL
jgi:bacteriorhodopsin